jgi:hypothetical protein
MANASCAAVLKTTGRRPGSGSPFSGTMWPCVRADTLDASWSPALCATEVEAAQTTPAPKDFGLLQRLALSVRPVLTAGDPVLFSLEIRLFGYNLRR